MAKYTNNYLKKKLAVGWSLIGLSLLLFVLSVIPNFVTTNFFLGVFGVVWYFYLTIMCMFGMANVMKLQFSYTKRFTIFLTLAIFAFIAILHTIFSNNSLYNNSNFDCYREYLSICYHMTEGVTVGGAATGVFVFLVRAVLGMVGVYAVLVMLLAIFVGIVLDAIIYKYSRQKQKTKQQNIQNNVSNVVNKQQFNETIISPESKEEELYTTNNNSYVQKIQKEEPVNEQLKEAKETLFSQQTYETYPSATSSNNSESETRSARDLLFGDRQVPNITMPNDRERDRWMKNYSEEESNRAVEDSNRNISTQDDDNVNSLFGRSPLSQSSDAFNPRARTFESEPSSVFGRVRPIDNSDDTMSDRADRLSRANIQDNIDTRRNITRQPINPFSTSKFGEDEEDKAKSSKIDFNNVSKPEKPEPISKANSGKQMGMAPIRYNGIPLSMFRVYKEENADYSAEYQKKSAALERVMSEFDINAKVINVVRGPKVTRYEMSLPAGIATSRVTALANNISMALESRSQIRIEAPIPGKNAIGVELENDKPSTVGMRELLESDEFTRCKDPLPIAIGKDINGKVIIKSLPKMIHLLVAGSSGSGKSIFIHSVMMSILYKYSPDDVRFIMIDPKRVEFTMYNNLPHLILPDVVYEHDKALNSLKWVVEEMMKRYELLRNTECQNLEQYNKITEVTSGQLPKMPYLVVVVDELAELMSGALKKDFENAIQRITQLGRAAGIHMVVATQRPSVDVVTGTIKNNFATRVAFALASSADSRTVLDEIGAESLLGKGDMLFAPQDSNTKIRLQAAFCDNDEIRNAIRYVKQNNQAVYDEEIAKKVNEVKQEESNVESYDDNSVGNSNGGMDDYMKLCVKFARDKGFVSISQLQRKFRIGFNRAANIVDKMDELGLIGPSVGSKPREFHITDEQFEELFGPDDEDDEI